MIQKALLEIDQSRGVQQSAAAGGRFRAGTSVTALAADRLNRSAANAVNAVAPRNTAQIRDGLIAVQYNPASIRYHAGTSTQKTTEPDVGTNTEMVTTITGKSTVDVSFQLVFHSVGEGDESVREQMELVMDMLYDSPTKRVSFYWGNIEMTGKLVSFSGEYDMFDELGRPISGHMQLTIRTETTVKQVERTLNRLDQEHRDQIAAQINGGG